MTVASPVSPRHVRHRKRSRLRRSKDFKSFLTKLQAALNATGAALAGWTAVGVGNQSILATAHGLPVGAGPFLATNVGGALPTPLVVNRLYWIVAELDANHFALAAEPNGAPIVLSAVGSGTNTLTKASTLDAVYDLLKKHGAPFMKKATDVDGI